MGIFKKLFGGSESTTGTQQFGGAFSTPESGRLARFAEGQLTGGPGEIFGTLQRELLQPSFAPRSGAEESLLKGTVDQLQGLAGARGVTPSVEGIAPFVAGQLQDFRGQRVSNLAQAFGQQTAGQGQQLQSLLRLIELAQPRLRAQGRTETDTGIIPGIAQLKTAFK